MTAPTRNASPGFALAVHGGAGTLRRGEMSEEQAALYHAGLRRALIAGRDLLAAGGSALDAVTAAGQQPAHVGALLRRCGITAGRGSNQIVGKVVINTLTHELGQHAASKLGLAWNRFGQQTQGLFQIADFRDQFVHARVARRASLRNCGCGAGFRRTCHPHPRLRRGLSQRERRARSASPIGRSLN